MDDTDRQRDLKILADSRDAFLASAQGLSDAQASARPSPGRWSVLDTVEHVAAIEDRLHAYLTTKLLAPVSPGSRHRENSIIRRTTDRSNKFVSPESLLPVGRFSTLADALAHFTHTRAQTILFIQTTPADLRTFRTTHPALGEVTAEEFLLLLAIHPARHALQIQEIRASLPSAEPPSSPQPPQP